MRSIAVWVPTEEEEGFGVMTGAGSSLSSSSSAVSVTRAGHYSPSNPTECKEPSYQPVEMNGSISSSRLPKLANGIKGEVILKMKILSSFT